MFPAGSPRIVKAAHDEAAFLGASLKALGLVITTRWRTVRSFRVRVAFAIGLYLLTIITGFAINAGVLFAELATYANSEEASLARAWLTDVANGDYSLLGISFVATGLGIALLAPFTGAGSLTLIDDDSAMPFSFPRGRRFLDSVAFAAISGVGLVHFLVAVLSASLLTVDGSRFFGIMLALILWLTFLALASMIGWLAEIGTGRYGVKIKWFYGAALATIGAIFYLSEGLQEILASAAGVYGAWVRSVAVAESIFVGIAMFLLAILLFVLVIVGGLHLARMWDNLPPHYKQWGRSSRAMQSYSQKQYGTRGLLSLQIKTLWRTREVKRTIIAVTIAGAVSSSFFFADAPDSILNGIMIGVPAISVLIWPANTFGPLGSGLTWLFSQPNAKTKFLTNSHVLATLQALIMTTALIAPVLVLHWDLLAEVDTYTWATGPLNAILLATVGMLLSILRPYTVRLSGRGESILPPSAAIGYLIGFGLLSGLNYLCLTAFVELGSYFILLYTLIYGVLLTVLIELIRSLWADPERQRKVLLAAAGD